MQSSRAHGDAAAHGQWQRGRNMNKDSVANSEVQSPRTAGMDASHGIQWPVVGLTGEILRRELGYSADYFLSSQPLTFQPFSKLVQDDSVSCLDIF